jgi:hypothetical protein
MSTASPGLSVGATTPAIQLGGEAPTPPVTLEGRAPAPPVRFATAEERDAGCVELVLAGAVLIELEGIGPSARGRLAEVIDEAIERALEARGAAGPGITSSADRDAALGDQLFRARRTGASGIAIVLGPLRASTGFAAAIEPEDCATLRFLAAAARERPLVLVLDERDAKTGAYGDPVPLAELIAPRVISASEPAPAPPPPLPLPLPLVDVDGDVDGDVNGDVNGCSSPSPSPSPSPSTSTSTSTSTSSTMAEVESLAAAPPAAARHTAGASIVIQEEAWRAWTLRLTAARGPQPLSAFEKLFAEAYMPLSNAIAAGLDDPRARHARDEFRTAFAKSYSDASATFASTTKRPRMVLDVHDTAARIARLHGARATRLVLVDGMRWDIGRAVEERLVARMGPRASLTDELLLWTALPSTTLRQLETIARGVEALRAPAELDEEPEPPRGRTAEYVRRMRVGPRELHKLDIVESRLAAAPPGKAMAAFPEIADAAADAIARHAETLAPRTLLFVFGDHGFTVHNGTLRQGGASPEEVLVGAFALLVGEVH